MIQLICPAVALLLSSALVGAFSPASRTAAPSTERSGSVLRMGLGDEIKQFLGMGMPKFEEPCVIGEESIMSKKKHGTSETPVQESLRWDCDMKVADRICNFNRSVPCNISTCGVADVQLLYLFRHFCISGILLTSSFH